MVFPNREQGCWLFVSVCCRGRGVPTGMIADVERARHFMTKRKEEFRWVTLVGACRTGAG